MGFSFFFILGAIGSGIMVISALNPVFSLFWLVVVFINSAVFFLLLGVDFIALMFLLVYVGAIAVLFLFVIMLLNLTDYPPAFFKREADMTNYIPIGFLIGVFFFSEVSSSWFVLGPLQIESWDLSFPWLILSYHNIEALGQVLYVVCFCLFILASFILLVAMIGAIFLTQETAPLAKKQDLFFQINR
uniref:NADH dehydrogenase subunit 6 n=1 Tax=Crispatotrochus rubescens TaxID=2989894 RepID=UPI00223898F1|nr:NADH dehydrogenase subunit 6 [Crispatotrochus rubescens]YP_010554992.1 NADH dehydrogenase subunit 6 [Crispatotrochus rugosus]UYP50959.1 NADH dehydrogenase subunit 6 [Crispatotrochus rubescens]UYP50972.1 NADH dehydrogenase subunit 6 [Crispatotrochus rugosus]